jgi:hypothetical protein
MLELLKLFKSGDSRQSLGGVVRAGTNPGGLRGVREDFGDLISCTEEFVAAAFCRNLRLETDENQTRGHGQ